MSLWPVGIENEYDAISLGKIVERKRHDIFIQAAKNQTPIISLNVNPDNFLNLYECGFYCNDNLNELIQNLKILLEDQELYNRYAHNCFEYVKRNHDIQQVVKQWIKLIKILSNNG